MSKSSQSFPIITSQQFQIGAWSLASLVSLLAILAWGSDINWQLSLVNVYLLFPLFGTLAFSLMWGHYVIGNLRDLLGIDPVALRAYFRYTGYAVLILLFLHPGLLIFQRFRDGFGLPPGSYTSYVAPGLGWVALLGTVSLLIFLAFEFHRIFGQQSWWRYVVDASDFAMLAVFYHALRLGQLHGWFRVVWWCYGIILIAILIRKYYLRLNNTKKPA